METNKYGYIYKITNLINGKIYVGQKKGSKLIEHYWGSGKLIKAAIEKYGKENFSREIIEWCSSRDELNAAEIKWIEELKCREYGYNICPGGSGGGPSTPEESKALSEKLKLYFSNPENRLKHSLAHQGISTSCKGRNASNDESVRLRALRQKEAYANGTLVPSMLGKHHSSETINKMSESKLAELNPFYGKHHSDESKKSMSNKLKGRIISETQKQQISAANSGEKNGMYGKPAPNAHKICITNRHINKYISLEDLDKYLAEGWIKGDKRWIK